MEFVPTTKVYAVGELRITHSRVNFGKRFFDGEFVILRDSGTPDIIPVSIPEIALPTPIMMKNPVLLEGELRSYKMPDSSGQLHRVCTIYAHSIKASEMLEHTQYVECSGFLMRKPIPRMTPKGRYITEIQLRVPRARGDKEDTIPVLIWGNMNGQIISNWEAGTPVTVCGRVQSREYQNRLGARMSIVEISAADFSGGV